jgi:hypothetical protein
MADEVFHNLPDTTSVVDHHDGTRQTGLFVRYSHQGLARSMQGRQVTTRRRGTYDNEAVQAFPAHSAQDTSRRALVKFHAGGRGRG